MSNLAIDKDIGYVDTVDDEMLPLGGTPLTIAAHPSIFLWALVDPHAPMCRHNLVALATGQRVPNEAIGAMTYLGTIHDVRLNDEQAWITSYVWHFFIGQGEPLGFSTRPASKEIRS